MAHTPENLPLAEQPLDDQALLACTFWLLLDRGGPVEIGALAGALQREPAAVAAAVDRLAQAVLTRRDGLGGCWAATGCRWYRPPTSSSSTVSATGPGVPMTRWASSARWRPTGGCAPAVPTAAR